MSGQKLKKYDYCPNCNAPRTADLNNGITRRGAVWTQVFDCGTSVVTHCGNNGSEWWDRSWLCETIVKYRKITTELAHQVDQILVEKTSDFRFLSTKLESAKRVSTWFFSAAVVSCALSVWHLVAWKFGQ